MPEDLSTRHGLIGTLFAQPSSAEEWAQYCLSKEQVEFYREDGYLAGVKILNDEQIDVLRDELRELVEWADQRWDSSDGKCLVLRLFARWNILSLRVSNQLRAPSGGDLMSTIAAAENKPHINVTPLIDVLLVLLIIFMVSVPLQPNRFAAKLPSQPDDRVLPPDPRTLVVTIEADRTLKLNALTGMGTIDDPKKLNETLAELFHKREKNHVYRDEMLARIDLPESLRIEKTVFIKAPRSISYGEVTRVIDGIKGAGANPIGLQLDNLN